MLLGTRDSSDDRGRHYQQSFPDDQSERQEAYPEKQMPSPSDEVATGPTVVCRSQWEGRPAREITTRAGEDLLASLQAANQPIASSCGGGVVCGRCVVEVLEGDRVLSVRDTEETRVLQSLGLGDSCRLACRTRPLEEGVVITTGYW